MAIHSKILTYLFIVFACCYGCFTLASPVYAEENKVVRVGFPIQTGLTEIDENGQPVGYTVAYLNQLSKYTNWEYEYVQVEGNINTQLTTLMDMLEKGEIDMMGAMNYMPSLQDKFFYSRTKYGTSYLTLAVPDDDKKWVANDYSNWDGIRIGTYWGFEKRHSILEKFAEVTGFTYELVTFDSFKQVLEALEAGQIDATLNVDLSMEKNLRSIARFAPSPYYMAVSHDREDLLDELNDAMYSLAQAYPQLETELYRTYFQKNVVFSLSSTDTEYVQNLGTLRVLFFDGNAPLQFENKHEVRGIAQTFLQHFAAATGLSYEPVVASTYLEGVDLIKRGEVDLIACVPLDASLVEEADLRLSSPYFTSYAVIVSSPDVEQIDYENVQVLSANIQNSMRQLLYSKNRSIMLDAYAVNSYLQKKHIYDDLKLEWRNNQHYSYSIGFTSHIDGQLTRLFNSYIASLTEEDVQDMVYQNSRVEVEYSLGELVSLYWMPVSGAVIGIGGLFALFFLAQKNHYLRAMKAESDRIHQFSKLIEEPLFEFDYKKDVFRIQNNRHLFIGQNEITGFMHLDPRTAFQLDFEQKLYAQLHEMFRLHSTQREIILTLSPGRTTWYRVDVRYVQDSLNDYAVGRFVDIDEEIRSKQSLQKQANTDRMTGLMNRAAFEQQLEEYVAKGGWEGLLILIDIDNFKKVNDTQGHMAGDQLLVNFARVLDKFFPPSDWKVRLGGDEFVVFIPHHVSIDYTQKNLKEFSQMIKETVFSHYPDIPLSMSIGACYMSSKLCTYQALYRAADDAMYQAKHNGKNQFRISDERECDREICIGCTENCARSAKLKQKGRHVSDISSPLS